MCVCIPSLLCAFLNIVSVRRAGILSRKFLRRYSTTLIEGKEGKRGATPIICLILDDKHAQHVRAAAEVVKARLAELIIIADNPKLSRGLVTDPIVIPSNGPLTALVATLPLQLIAYELAVRKFNPDKPWNLAKAVTVD